MRTSLPLALIAATLSCAQAATAAAGGIVERHLTAESPALGHPIAYSVYAPASAPPAGTRWPVVYLLHGGGGSGDDWLDLGHIAATLDGAIASGAIKPIIAVMPDGGGTSWFVDNPDPGGDGKVETALTSDLVRAVDASLPTAACREGRAVAGLSMGGYGAALFALDDPDRFSAAIVLSGAIARPIEAGDTERIKRGQDFYDGAFGNPFDVRRFNALNLYPRIAADAARSDRPSFWITAGDRDGAGIITGSADFHVALRRAGYDTTLRIGPGRHDWANWGRSILPALEWASPRLGDHCPIG